jgi:hypothetical protein
MKCMKQSAVIFTFVFSAANLITMFVCLALVTTARQQALIEQRGSYDFGDSLNFITFLPVLGACLLIDIVWGIMALVGVLRRRDYRFALAWVAIVALWAVVVPVARAVAGLPLNPAASGNGAVTSLFHAGRQGRAVPEPQC